MFRRGRKLILLEDVTISALIERVIEGEKIPEPVGIHTAQRKTYRQIHDEIQAAQHRAADPLGGAPTARFVRRLAELISSGQALLE